MSLNDFNLGTSSAGGATGGASGFRASSPSEGDDAIVRRNDDIPATLQPSDLETGAGLQAASPEERDGLQFGDFVTGAGLRTSSPKEEDKTVQLDSIPESFQSSDQGSELRRRSERSVRPKVREEKSKRPQVWEKGDMSSRPEVREVSVRPIVRERGEVNFRPAFRVRGEMGCRPDVPERGQMSYRPQFLESSEVTVRPRIRERSHKVWPREGGVPESTARAISHLENLLSGPAATTSDNEKVVKKRRVHFGNYLPTINDEEEMGHSVEDAVKEMKPLSISCGQEEVVPFNYGEDNKQASNSGVQEPLAPSGIWGVQQQVAQASNPNTEVQRTPSSILGDQQRVQPSNFSTVGSLVLGSEGGGENPISPTNDGDLAGGVGRPTPNQEDSYGTEYQEALSDYLADVEARLTFLFYEDREGH